MIAYLVIPLVEVVFCIALLVLLITSGMRHVARKPFAVFLSCMALWGFFIFMMRASSNLTVALLWEKFVFFSILSAALFFYKFTISFTSARQQNKVLYSLYFIYVAIMCLIPTGLVVSGMQMMWYGKAPIIGLFFFPYVLTVYAPLVLGLILLIKHYRRSRVLNERIRDSYVMAGLVVMFIGGTTDYLPALGLSMYPLGIIGNILFCLLATIAMLRYGLLEIKVVLRKGAAYTIISMFIVGIFGSLIFLLSNVFQELTSPVSLIITVFTVFIVAAAFQPFLSRVQRLVDRWFFRQRYNHLQALERFTKETKDIIDLKQLSSSLLSMIVRGMQSCGVDLLLPSSKTGDFITYSCIGEKRKGQVSFAANSLLTMTMKYQDGPIDGNDIDTIPSLRGISNKDRDTLLRNQIELLVPLKTKKQLTGMVLLRSKQSGEPYSAEERQLLQLVSNQAAISIENARLYEELRQQLISSSKLASLGELAANVAHEVNNSLQSVINYGAILHEDMEEDDLRKDDCKAIETEALRARNIVESLLGIARQERTEKIAVEINDLLHSVSGLAEVRAKARSISIIENYSREVPLVQGSAEQIRQVFLNLFTNAVDAMPDGGRIEVKTSVENKHVIVTVADTGVGIPSHIISKIFDPLFTTKDSGSGLGLTVSLSIIRDHGGTIKVDSEEGKGTEFTVTLPRLE
jgi:signal transduction histidine kinase